MDLNALSAAIASQPGASSGLWTHTSVDWAGSQDVANPELKPPTGWPTDAFMARDDAGARPGIDHVPPPLDLPPAPL